MKLQESTTKEDYSAVKAECLQLISNMEQQLVDFLGFRFSMKLSNEQVQFVHLLFYTTDKLPSPSIIQ
jgi:hypothetical protein